ncbi:MAG TPA: hypothetical protein VMV79_01880 [Alphaproteobacteria bacterium]|nr:hypothetical protein [Alphaproteobacteria bacterium]
MTRSINLDELREHLGHAKEKLAREKSDILNLNPLRDGFCREEYAFAYVRAERLGMRAINRRLSEIDWLPMQLDAKSEIVPENRASMKRWLTSPFIGKPGAEEFGNDFMHSLARCGLAFGWDGVEFLKLAARVANLFRDLSCLIGIVYYCSWLAENRVADVRLSNPDDLTRTAEEISELMQSPEIYRYIRAPEQNDEGKSARGKGESGAAGGAMGGMMGSAGTGKDARKSKKRPALYVIANEDFHDPFAPEPAPA